MHHQRRGITLPAIAFSLLALCQASSVYAQTTLPAVTVLHTFAGGIADGFQPRGELLQATDGAFYGTTQAGGTAGLGTIYKITADGTSFTLIHSFTGGTDGAVPQGRLIQLPDGTIYGTTNQGGTHNLGTVFKLDLVNGNNVAIVHEFAGAPADGSLPASGLTLLSDGTLLGATATGAGSDFGTIYQITSAGVYSIVHTFVGSTDDGSTPVSRLTFGRNGNLFGTTMRGGANLGPGAGLGTVYELTPTGTFAILHSFADTEGTIPEGNIIQGYDANFYGLANSGGANGLGSVYKVAPDGTVTALHSFTGTTADGSSPIGDILQGTDGFLYGTTIYGGANGTGSLFKLDPDGTYTLLYSFSAASTTTLPTDGSNPVSGLIQGADGNLYGVSGDGGASNGGAIIKVATALSSTQPVFTGLSIAQASTPSGVAATGTVTIATAAPAGGVGISLSSSDTTVATVGPVAVIPAGLSTVTFPITALSVTGSTSVTITGTYGGVTKTATLIVTPAPGTTFAKGLNFFSIPYDFSTIDIPSLFGYSSATVAFYVPSKSSYALTPTAPADRIRPGFGYWIRFPNAITITRTGTPVDTTQDVSITLGSGWNQIGNPFLVNIPINTLTFNGTGLTYDQASGIQYNLINPKLYGFVPSADGTTGSYTAMTDTDNLVPGQAYWIQTRAATTLQWPHPATTTSSTTTLMRQPLTKQHGIVMKIK